MSAELLSYIRTCPVEWLILTPIFLFKFAIPLAVIVLITVFVVKGSKERSEIKKELEQLREEIKKITDKNE